MLAYHVTRTSIYNFYILQADGLRFEFEFNLSYFDFVSTDDIPSEESTTNRPARYLKNLAPLDITPEGSSTAGSQYILRKRHISFGIFGLDEFTWNGYAFCDTDEEEDSSFVSDAGDNMFDTQETGQTGENKASSCGSTTSDARRRSRQAFLPDLLAAGILDANQPCCQPREYFLQVLRIRMLMIERRWHFVTGSITAAIQRHVGRLNPLASR